MKIENLKSYNNLKSVRNCPKAEAKSNLPDVSVQNEKISTESYKAYFLGRKSDFASMTEDDFLKMLDTWQNLYDVEPIAVENDKISKLFQKDGTFSFENIKNALNNTNINNFRISGFNLKYPRKNFIEDFKTLLSDLSYQDQKIVYSYFNFYINENNDIKKYPMPKEQIDEGFSPKIKNKLEKANVLINNFMFENKVVLKEKDKPLENLLNETINIFPEFITIIGKRQHRGDTMDFHTFDDIKRVYNNPEFKNLSDEDKKILFISLLFHDFSKQEAMVDRIHPQTSAIFAEKIIQKLPLDNKNKERICNFIKHSHFVVDGDTEEQIAQEFKTLKDFKMVEILARADSASAGFSFLMSSDTINSIQNKIKKMNG